MQMSEEQARQVLLHNRRHSWKEVEEALAVAIRKLGPEEKSCAKCKKRNNCIPELCDPEFNDLFEPETAEPEQGNADAWIKITYDENGVLNCQMPEDGQEIIVAVESGNTIFTWADECIADDCDDNGPPLYELESTRWGWQNVVAWMPIPKYKT